MSFSALLCAQSFPLRNWDTATVSHWVSWPNCNRRRRNVLECTWKSKYFRYRHVVPDLPAKSSSLDSSIARHWGNRSVEVTKSPSEANNSRQSPVEANIIMFTLFPSFAITSFLRFWYWGITFTQCATKCPGINCYYKHQSSSLLLLRLVL